MALAVMEAQSELKHRWRSPSPRPRSGPTYPSRAFIAARRIPLVSSGSSGLSC